MTATLKYCPSPSWLQKIARSLLAAGVPLVGVAACECPPEDHMYLIPEGDDSVAALVEACRRPVDAECLPLCEFVSAQHNIVHCELHASKDGYLRVHVGSENQCGGGRRPWRLRFAKDSARTSVARWLARMSQLEAASVPAFRRLAGELRHHDAPASLVDAARAAAHDEIRHARALRAIVRAHGAQAGSPRCPAPVKPPSLFELARANEVEGCVRESYGALLAAHQGAVAADVQVRAAMAAIAPDELRHADLARAIRVWAWPKLTAVQRSRVRTAGLRELERMAHAAPMPESVREQLGFPSAQVSNLMLHHLAQELV